MYNYKGIWNPVQSVVGETLNCEHKVKNPQDLYAVSLWKYGTTVSHVLRTCHLMHLHVIFNTEAWWCLQAHFDGPLAQMIPMTCHKEV